MNFFCYFFGIFLLESSTNGIRILNFFLPFSAYLIPLWLKIMPERGFLDFFGIFLPGSSIRGIQAYNFFLPFSAYLIRFWLEILPEIGFLILSFFSLFFSEFPCPVYERNWSLKFFSPFLVLSHPVLAKNNAGKRDFIILNFFAIFFGIFLTGSSMNGIRD